MTGIASVDAWLFERVNGLAGQSASLDAVVVAVAKYSPIFVAAVLVILWLRWRAETQRMSAVAAIAALSALAIGQVIGRLLPRARPYDVLNAHLLVPHSADTSFPSDHATLVFAVAVVVWRTDRRLGVALLAFAALTMTARVWVGAHYPLDVIGGALLGSVTAWAVARWSERGPLHLALIGTFKLLAKCRLAAKDGLST